MTITKLKIYISLSNNILNHLMSLASFICYEETVYFHCHQDEYLFSRGFIDDELHLSPVKSVECEFRFEQKNYQIEQNKKSLMRQVVVFGTEILIKHVFSNYYVSFQQADDGNDTIYLRKDPSESCYFQLIPQRSFQHKGDPITANSSFSILHASTKSYLGSNIFEVNPLKSKIRMEMKSTKILQSYHLTRQISQNQNGKKDMNEVDQMMLALEQSNLKESIEKREKLNQEIVGKTSSLKRAGSLNSVSEHGAEVDHFLPIQSCKSQKIELMSCSIEKHAHTMWQTLKKEPNSSSYLHDNDYIYFVSSFKNKGTMVIQQGSKNSYNIEFLSKQENEYECSAIFIVEIDRNEKEEFICLRHLITGKYFPFTDQNVKKRLKLVPLLPQSSYENKLPPFHIYFDGQFFPREFQDYQNTCGFWLNKVDKIEINEILSLQNMPHTKWIPYLTKYLDTDRRKKQQLLRQFGLLKHLVFNVIKELKSSKELYTLLFKMINQNKKIRRQMAGYIGELVKNQRKQFLIDIFSEIFNSTDNLVEKYIQSEHLSHQITDFKIEDTYSINYMRIFRLFCGHYMEPCERNQNVIYGLFFNSGLSGEKNMTESYLRIDRNKIDEKYKFKIVFRPENQIKIENCHKLSSLAEFSPEVQQYIRQYLYLLGDCLKQNKTRIEQFKSNHGYTIDNLLDILSNKDFQELQGPIINLINVAYLNPEYKYKLYVYIKDYDQMCYNGSLVALQRNESIKRLLEFINRQKDIIKERVDSLEMLKTRDRIMKEEKIKSTQLEQLIQEQNVKIIQEFASTKFKRFLIMVKHTIENGYWDSISNLELIVDTLSTLYRKKEEKILRVHEDYEQVHEWKNYMDSTVLIIDIAILYLDIQINLCISNLITIKEDKVGGEIEEFVNSLQKNKQFQNRFDYFQLTDPENEELMKKSLILSRKYYEIKSIILKNYSEDIVSRKSGVSHKSNIQFIKQSVEDLKLNNHISISKCKSYIQRCLIGINIEDLNPSELLKYGFILKPVLKYSKIVTEFQTLTFKLGVVEILTDSIERYMNLRSKQKNIEEESIYWKILLLYVLINSNKPLKKEIINIRSSLIPLVLQENFNSFVAIDILVEIYSNNRSIIVSDREEIKQLCMIFVELMSRDNMCEYTSKNYLNVKINKMLYLIHAFLVVDGKKIKNSFSLVLNELFDKQVLITYICKLKSTQNGHLNKAVSSVQDIDHNTERCNNYLFQILLFRLTETLEQKPQKMNFFLPRMEHIMNLVLMIGKRNLKLVFDIFGLLGEEEIQRSEIFKNYFRRIVDSICEVTFEEFRVGQNQRKKQFGEYSDQIQVILIHFPVLIRITKIIIEGTVCNKNNMFQPLSPAKFQKMASIRLDLLERLFLFNHYLEPRVVQKLVALVRDNLHELSGDEYLVEKLLSLDFQIVSVSDLKESEFRLTQINQKKKSHLSRLKRLDSKIVIRGSKNVGLLQIINQIHEYALIKNNREFNIQNAKQFINSLTYINKRDQNNLDTQLKSFFLSFLINIFPSEPHQEEETEKYHRQLEALQNLLVQYGSAELVSSMLEEKFKENYWMFINLFEYANKLLEGGNVKAQHSFYDIFLRDHKNVTFENIKIIIENSTMGLKFFFHSYPKLEDSRLSSQDDIIYPENRNISAMRQKKNFSLIIKRTFRFLQLLCENDNQLLKNYIYKQINQDRAVKYMSVNFLQIAINNFCQLVEIVKYNLEYHWTDEGDRKQNKEIIDDLLNVLVFILDFLIEVCQYPAFKNQVFICNTDFFDNIDLINELSALYSAYYDDSALMLTIERKIVMLLRGLLQEKNKMIIESLMKKLNIEGLMLFVKASLDSIDIKTREQYIEMMSHNHDKLIEEIQNVVDVLIVTNSLGLKLEDQMSSHFQILDQIRKQIREIEVDFRGNLTTISFCYRPIFNYLSRDTKEYFINEFSKHESRNQKLKDIINMRNIINQDILQRKSRQLIMSETATNNLFHFSITLCFLLVSLQLFFFSVNKIGIALDHIEHNIIRGLSFMQFLTTLIYFVLWGVNISPITIEKIKQKHHKHHRQQEDHGWNATMTNYYILVKQIYFEEGSSLHAVLLLSVSICACFYQIRMYSFVILYIFAKIQLLRDILSAISVTWRQLALVSLLSMAFNFIFGMMSINNYISVLYENQSIDIDIDHLTSHCSTIMSCIDSLFAQRIIGETPSRVGDSSHYGRLFSDAVYWAFFEIIIPNLTAAIIIDKFAELRNSKQKMQKEQNNKCLICFAQKSSIERKGENFDQHKARKHCIWDYFFYLYYLQKLKSNTEYTGVEYWIVEQLKNEKVEWFPLDESQKEDFGEKKAELLFEEFKKKLLQNKHVLHEILEE